MNETAESQPGTHVELTAEIVSAYVANNSVPATDLPALISAVHGALNGLAGAPSAEVPAVEKLTSAQIRKSITPDHLVSFEDGKTYKTLRRHLTLRGLTPETYREKWGLPRDYPMTSANYSAQRSELARTLGLGQQRRKAKEPEAAPAPVAEAPAPKARGRKKAAESVPAE